MAFPAGFQRPRTGNPFAGNREKWRAALNKAVTPKQFDTILRRTIELAEDGEEWAVKEIFDRLMGKATQTLELDAKVSVEQVWTASADDLIALARQAGMVDQLPPRLRALADAPRPQIVDTTAEVIEVEPNPETAHLTPREQMRRHHADYEPPPEQTPEREAGLAELADILARSKVVE